MSDDWYTIENIPEGLMDGREVYVKRVYKGRVGKEGHAQAPRAASLRRMAGHDDIASANTARVTKRWLNSN